MAELSDFTYPDRVSPVGVIDSSMPPEIVRVIAALAPAIGRALAGPPDRTLECGLACKFWMEGLQRVGVPARIIGGVGVDDDAFTSNYQLVPLDRRSGYQEGDGQVHRHFWLVIGDERLIFDPTAHQFDTKGGVSWDRYVVDGSPFRPP